MSHFWSTSWPLVAFDDGKQLDPAIHPPCRRPVKNATSPQLGHIDAVGPREPTFLATASSPFRSGGGDMHFKVVGGEVAYYTLTDVYRP